MCLEEMEDPKQLAKLRLVSIPGLEQSVGADPTETTASPSDSLCALSRKHIAPTDTPIHNLPMSFFERAVRRYPDSYTAQIIALDAYCSNLSARLVSTLDALDALQSSHKQELQDLQHRMQILHAKYRFLKQRVKSAEKERDDLREGVETLIQKVELANDYRVLPHATIHMSSPLEPIQTDQCQDLLHPPDTKIHLISMLVNQLTFHKDSHMQLKRSSDARIASLEAQLARRDFEIQNYRPCTCLFSHAHGSQPKTVPAQSGAHSTSDNTVLPNPPFIKYESTLPLDLNSQSRVLDETAQRQRILQTEVALLHEKLDNEKKLLSEAFSMDGQARPTAPGTVERLDPPLDTDADDLRAERHRITSFVPPESDKDDEQLKQCLLLEEECIRLRKSEHELRQKLLLASATEQVLRDSVTSLQEQLRNVNGHHPMRGVSDMPALARMNRVQTELEEARAEANRRQIAIDELRRQITLLQDKQNVKDTG